MYLYIYHSTEFVHIHTRQQQQVDPIVGPTRGPGEATQGSRTGCMQSIAGRSRVPDILGHGSLGRAASSGTGGPFHQTYQLQIWSSLPWKRVNNSKLEATPFHKTGGWQTKRM